MYERRVVTCQRGRKYSTEGAEHYPTKTKNICGNQEQISSVAPVATD